MTSVKNVALTSKLLSMHIEAFRAYRGRSETECVEAFRMAAGRNCSCIGF